MTGACARRTPAAPPVPRRPYPARMQDDDLLETTVERRVIHAGRYLTVPRGHHRRRARRAAHP